MIHKLLKRPQAIIGLCLIAIVIVIAIAAPAFSPHDPELVNLSQKYAQPDAEYPLGTDQLGRCTLSRLLYGARYSIGISLPALLILSVIGLIVGTFSACAGEKADHFITILCDVFIAFPSLTAFGHAMDDSTNQTRYLGMNLNKAPFNDPLVREAVSYAVNQQELETSVFDGLETAAETLFTNEKPNCGVEVKTYPTDMEKAKQLMKEAGYEDTNDDGILEKDGTSLAIHFNYSQSLASIDNAVLSIAASLKELGFDVTIDAVDMNTWYGDLMAGEYDLTFYNTAGGSFDPATDMSNMAPGAMGDPILCQFSAFFENPEIFAELDSTSDSQRVQEIYGMILNGIADQNLLVPVTGTHDLALWNTDKITGYDFYTDASYVDIASVHVK